MSHFETFRARSSRRPALALVLALCATAVLLWVPILALNQGPVWFW